MSEFQPRTLGERVTRLRRMRNWTQVELAGRIRIHPAHLSRIEKDRMRPKAGTLTRLAEAFGVSVDELTEREDTPPELKDETLLRAFHQAQQLDPEDRRLILRMVSALLTKKRVEQAIQIEDA